MEQIISQLLQDFENGKMSRRQLIHSLAFAATAASAVAVTASSAQAAGGFKTIALDHISYQVANYKRTRDFYTDLMGMTVSDDNGNSQCQLHFGDSMLIARNRHAAAKQSRVDHIAYRIDDWDTDRVKSELERRQLKPRLDTGGPAGPPNYASFHVSDPDGFDLQISGVVKPGDSLYKKPGANR
jgi:catechol 2,3-dioxygenase-like lactoylglutathione lyase family enzyme